ncbi:unnamed protein product, partial [Rotaria sordida]
MPPKIIDKVDFSFKIDESIISQDEAQAMYNQMRQITKDFRTQAMTLCVQSTARENEILSDEIKGIIERFPQENDDGFDAEPGYAAFQQYYELREKRMKLEVEQSLYFLFEQRVEGEINNSEEEIIAPTLIQEHQLLKLGPKFIFNDPKAAARRRITELATLNCKIKTCFLHGLLQMLHNVSITNKNIKKDKLFDTKINQNNSIIELINSQATQSQIINRVKVTKKKNYGRLVKRLKHKFKLANVTLQKSDKSKVFHLGKIEDYRKKSKEYMEKTQAYKCLGKEDPLPELIQRTNKYFIKPNEVELAHLYYLPKAHKPGTPLRPIISGLKHPTIKISKFLDDLLRPIFDGMAKETTTMVNIKYDILKKLLLTKRRVIHYTGNHPLTKRRVIQYTKNLFCCIRINSPSRTRTNISTTTIIFSRLAPHQINRRQYGAYTFDALMLMNKYNYSDGFSLSEQDANELASRLQVGKSIIIFNAQRLRSICHTLIAFHQSFRRYVP